jgi:hypothetical protein
MRVVPVVAAMELGRSGSQAAVPVLMLGAGAAMILDAGLLGYETLDSDAPKVSLAPSFDPKSRTGALVVAGSF